MTHKFIILAFVVMSFGFAGCAAEQYSQTRKDHLMKVDSLRMMKMEDVIALSKAGVSDSLIIGMMDATDSWFQLKTQDVLDLRNAGVSEKVVVAMMQPPPQPSGKTSDSNVIRYYGYPSYFWYDGYSPYWYYPTFSVRMGYHPYHFGFSHHGRFR
ncbi:MAG: hypothetical protein NTX44_06240 [Ignavibacteriales bacterium]|nr:hypothetical protein [Ignavibacteriales bacterium]